MSPIYFQKIANIAGHGTAARLMAVFNHPFDSALSALGLKELADKRRLMNPARQAFEQRLAETLANKQEVTKAIYRANSIELDQIDAILCDIANPDATPQDRLDSANAMAELMRNIVAKQLRNQPAPLQHSGSVQG